MHLLLPEVVVAVVVEVVTAVVVEQEDTEPLRQLHTE
jgi:hypothetical protein